jgi:2-oxo-3-hexenedioate decarboxylase
MRLETGAIAIELLDALDRGRTIRSVVERHPGFEWDDGYKVAADLLALRQRRGERPVGRKIGFTNRNIWPEYGATSPIWAHVYDRTLVFARDHRARVSLRGAARPRLEPEIAFKLKATLPAGVSDPAQVLQLIEWFAPSFEIVDCHLSCLVSRGSRRYRLVKSSLRGRSLPRCRFRLAKPGPQSTAGFP